MQYAYHITRATISQASSDIVLRYLEIPASGISEFRQTCVFMEILTCQPFRQNPVSLGIDLTRELAPPRSTRLIVDCESTLVRSREYQTIHTTRTRGYCESSFALVFTGIRASDPRGIHRFACSSMKIMPSTFFRLTNRKRGK